MGLIVYIVIIILIIVITKNYVSNKIEEKYKTELIITNKKLRALREINEEYENILKDKNIDVNYIDRYKKLEQENKELKEKLNKQKENYKAYLKNKEENIKKGQDYELKIKIFYENLGYKVYPNGYINKKNDKGIDLIAYKNNEVHLIQCKCYKNPPKQELIRKFIGDCEVYIKNNTNKLNNKTIYKDFITSCKNKDYGVIKFLEENKNIIDYLIIE